jgi:hypothetical protein
MIGIIAQKKKKIQMTIGEEYKGNKISKTAYAITIVTIHSQKTTQKAMLKPRI